MNYYVKKCISHLVFLILITAACLFTYYIVPPLLIQFTSTKLDSLRRVMAYQTQLNHLGGELKKVEILQSKYMKLHRNQNKGQIRSKVETLRHALDEYTQDKSEFDIKKFDVLIVLQIKISEIRVEMKTTAELPKFPSMAFLVWPILCATSDYAMWVFGRDIEFLNAVGGIRLDDTNSDSSLSLAEAQKIRVFIEKHGIFLYQLADSVKNKRNEIIGLLDKLDVIELANHDELIHAAEMDVDTLSELGELAQEFQRIVSLRRQSIDLDLDKNKTEL